MTGVWGLGIPRADPLPTLQWWFKASCFSSTLLQRFAGLCPSKEAPEGGG